MVWLLSFANGTQKWRGEQYIFLMLALCKGKRYTCCCSNHVIIDIAHRLALRMLQGATDDSDRRICFIAASHDVTLCSCPTTPFSMHDKTSAACPKVPMMLCQTHPMLIPNAPLAARIKPLLELARDALVLLLFLGQLFHDSPVKHRYPFPFSVPPP
jgi:hypothetical protein